MTTALLLLSLVAAMALAIAAVDLWRFLATWGGRIRTGRWNDRSAWRKALALRARAWLRHMPAVPKKDQGRFVLWDMARGTYAHAAIQGWQLAGLALGLAAHARQKGDEQLIEKLRRALAAHELVHRYRIDPSPAHWEIDRMLLDYAVLETGAEDAGLVERSVAFLGSLKTGAGTLAYRAHQPGVRYVDTLGLACPLAAACAARTGREDLWQLAVAPIEEYDRALLHGSSLPAHGFEMERGYPLGLYDWSRGIGWYALGLCEVHRHLAAAGRPEAAAIAGRIRALATELLPLQKKNGGFGWMVARPESVFESSGTALIGLLMLTASRLTGNARFLDAARRVERALMGVTRRNGALDMCQGDTKGIGMYSDVWSIMPFAQGMALRLAAELDREETLRA